jgi:3-hydroxyanthranilate 3,4-dioxygenase
MIQRAFNLNKWIDEHRHLLKPPVGNQSVYKEAGDFIVMVVGGPNSRKDFHFNEGEELFYQLQGDIVVRIQEDDKIVDISIKEGDMFLLPGRTPHSPQRGTDTVGLVIEIKRKTEEMDGFMWFCENCDNKLYEEFAHITNIVEQLPPIMNRFYTDIDKCTCKKCGTIMQPPTPVK